MSLPTVPFGGLIGIVMVASSFFVKSHKDFLFYGGLAMWGYHFMVGSLPFLVDIARGGLRSNAALAPNNLRLVNYDLNRNV